MKWWRRCGRRSEAAPVVSADLVEKAQAEDRLRSVERRVEPARRAILARHERNHWSETIQAILKEGRA